MNNSIYSNIHSDSYYKKLAYTGETLEETKARVLSKRNLVKEKVPKISTDRYIKYHNRRINYNSYVGESNKEAEERLLAKRLAKKKRG